MGETTYKDMTTETPLTMRPCVGRPVGLRAIKMKETFSVDTPTGTLYADVGDYLIIGDGGERYPCDANVFESVYRWSDESEFDKRTMLPSVTVKQKVPGLDGNIETLYMTIAEVDGRPYSVFFTFGKAGSDAQALLRPLGQIVSKLMRVMTDQDDIFKMFRGHEGTSIVFRTAEGPTVKSLVDGFWHAWEKYKKYKNPQLKEETHEEGTVGSHHHS